MAVPQFHKNRVRENLAREIGWTISNRLRDPRIPPIVTVTDVILSDDLRNATVYVSVLGEDEEKGEAVDALNHAVPFVGKTVAERVRMKNFPKLYFKADNSLDRGKRVDELLDEIKDDLD